MIPAPEGITTEDYKTYSSRWVGNAMRACPAEVPWQRVINSQGKISDRPGALKQRQLLEAEGVQFVKDKANLKQLLWPQPEPENKPIQASLF